MLNRICRICTTEDDRSLEIEKLKHILWLNQYPAEVVNKVIEKEINKPKEQVLTAEKMKRFIVLPFGGQKSEEFGTKLKNLVESNFPQVDFNVAFQTPSTIGNLFPFKDKIKNIESQSLVVYKIKCRSCEASYIGKTERILYHRLQEHKTKSSSACFQHSQENQGHEIDWNNVEIVDRADNNLKLQVKELLHILKIKPTLNKQLNSQSNYDIKTIIVKAYQQFHEGK